ncbi:MAG: phosphoenolpyruvate--protein phosphotransferase [Alphaproteobacteria bacterium]
MQQNAAELSRSLLAKLRDIMSSAGDDEVRLQQLVGLISEYIEVEVCSIYLLRAGEVLELFATSGLRMEAIHQTRLRVGEGLVGLTAATKIPQNISDVSHHPDFAFRPETGEEHLQSFLGVPILRQDHIIGVLVIQSKNERVFADPIVEILQNIAMLLAEFLIATKISNRDEVLSTQGLLSGPVTFKGVVINQGVAVGKAVLHEPKLSMANILSEDSDKEHERLSHALKEMHMAIDDMLSRKEVEGKGEHRDILETYALIAKDAGWIKQIHEAIDEGLSAVAAVRKVTNMVKLRLSGATDPYLRERAMDFEDLGDRVLYYLDPEAYKAHLEAGFDEIILFARTMGPARLLDFDRKKLKGLVLSEASKNSHVAIVAKALDIPVLGLNAEYFHKVETGDDVCLDAGQASLVLRADDDVKESFRQAVSAHKERTAKIVSLQNKPAISLDGKRISLRINAGLRSDMDYFDHVGANGVGLFRTEIPFMVRSHLPTVEWQKQIYEEVLKKAAGKPVVFRTLDVGGDKVLPWRQTIEEENSAMGWRAVRVSVDIPALLRNQLKALVQAAEGQELRVLFPMVTEMSEWYFCRTLLMEEITRHKEKTGKEPIKVQVGIMFEVPALMLQMDEMLDAVDFVSIGSNDLAQFLFASDRGSPLVSERFDPTSLIMLKFYRRLLQKASAKNVSVTLCGEVASDPLGALALVGVGFKRLSMSPLSIPSIRDMICSVDIANLQNWMESQLENYRQRSLRKELKNWAKDHDVYLPKGV